MVGGMGRVSYILCGALHNENVRLLVQKAGGKVQ